MLAGLAREGTGIHLEISKAKGYARTALTTLAGLGSRLADLLADLARTSNWPGLWVYASQMP